MGVGYRDLGYYENSCPLVNDDPQVVIQKQEIKNSDLDLKNYSDANTNQENYIFKMNPKQITIKLLNSILNKNENNDTKTINSLNMNEIDIIRNIYDLNNLDPTEYVMCYDYSNQHLIFLQKTILKLKKNGINVVLYIPPYTKAYLEKIPDDIDQRFRNQIVDTSTRSNVKFYDLSTKYSEMNIFQDHTHVARNSDSRIYSMDIANIILSNLNNQSEDYSNVSKYHLTNKTNFENLYTSNTKLTGADLSLADLVGRRSLRH